MTVGIIGYLSARGLGTMTHDLRVQLGIKRQMVPVDEGWPYVPSWATGGEFFLDQWEVQKDDLIFWKQFAGIDTIVCVETPFGDNVFKWAKELGMRTVLVVMWEAFNPHMPAYRNVDLYIAPSYRCYQEVPFDSKIFLPYPVDTKLFEYRQRTDRAKTFLHCAGSGGMNGRKGTQEAIQGFCLAAGSLKDEVDIRMIVRSQQGVGGPVSAAMAYGFERIRFEGATENREDLYKEGDVLIATHFYDGHFLVGLEAMASGMPVITTDASPMNEFWPPDESQLLVDVISKEKPSGLVNPHCMMNIPNVADIADKIRYCATHDMSLISARNREIAETENSWGVLRERWKKAVGIQ